MTFIGFFCILYQFIITFQLIFMYPSPNEDSIGGSFSDEPVFGDRHNQTCRVCCGILRLLFVWAPSTRSPQLVHCVAAAGVPCKVIHKNGTTPFNEKMFDNCKIPQIHFTSKTHTLFFMYVWFQDLKMKTYNEMMNWLQKRSSRTFISGEGFDVRYRLFNLSPCIWPELEKRHKPPTTFLRGY